MVKGVFPILKVALPAALALTDQSLRTGQFDFDLSICTHHRSVPRSLLLSLCIILCMQLVYQKQSCASRFHYDIGLIPGSVLGKYRRAPSNKALSR